MTQIVEEDIHNMERRYENALRLLTENKNVCIENRAKILELRSKRLAQPYQAAWLLEWKGKRPNRGDTIGFVKVLPFRLQGRQFTVKPTVQANLKEIDADDYVLSLFASLSQVFDPMNIKLRMNPTSLSDFVR